MQRNRRDVRLLNFPVDHFQLDVPILKAEVGSAIVIPPCISKVNGPKDTEGLSGKSMFIL